MMRRKIRRRRAPQQPGVLIRQVDRLLRGEPMSVAVTLRALPEKQEQLVATYARLFESRGYVLHSRTALNEDELNAVFARRGIKKNGRSKN